MLIKLPEMKSTMSEMKNILDDINRKYCRKLLNLKYSNRDYSKMKQRKMNLKK